MQYLTSQYVCIVPIVLYPVRSRSCVTEYIGSEVPYASTKPSVIVIVTEQQTLLFLPAIVYLSYLLLILSRTIDRAKEVRGGKGKRYHRILME